MSDDRESEDYEVGYRKPPQSRQFKRGVSGNPSGRPKRAPDFDSQLMRELNSKLTITENGKRRVIRKSEALAKQLMNKAISVNHSATRLVVPYCRQAFEKAAEEERHAQRMANRPLNELTEEELWMNILRDPKYSDRIDKFLEDIVRGSSSTEPDPGKSIGDLKEVKNASPRR